MDLLNLHAGPAQIEQIRCIAPVVGPYGSEFAQYASWSVQIEQIHCGGADAGPP